MNDDNDLKANIEFRRSDEPLTEADYQRLRSKEAIATAPVDVPLPAGALHIEADMVTGTGENLPAKQVAARLVDLVNSGQTPAQAVQQLGLGLSFKDVLKKDGVKEALRALVVGFHVPAAAQREIVRAARLKVLTEALSDGDNEMVLAASKQIASDPDVGLNSPPVPPVNIDLRDLKSVLDNVAPLPGMEGQNE